jgi:NTP pyrophosphatase (non-canonical NTP hydrolase)
MRTFKEVYDRSIEVISSFREVEKKPWGVEGALIEMQKQMGELAKQVMSHEGYYMKARDDDPKYQASVAGIADELSDIMLMVFRIADHYGIDIEKEHMREMDEAMKHPSMKVKP